MTYTWPADGSVFIADTHAGTVHTWTPNELDHLMRSAVEFMRFCGRDVVLSERVVESPLMEPYEG